VPIISVNIDSNSPEEWNDFLECGSRIRKKNSALEVEFWQDTKTVAHVNDSTRVESYAFWTLEGGGREARIGAYKCQGSADGYIGWYECDPDEAISKQLFNAAFEWMKEQGCESVIGPVNGSSWYSYRFNLEHAQPLFPGDPFQPLYYVEQWQNAGFGIMERYESSYTPLPEQGALSFEEAEKQFNEKGLVLKRLTPELYMEHRTVLHGFLNEAFTNNPLFVEIDIEEFGSIYDELPSKLPEGFAYMAVDKSNAPVCLNIAYPDIFYTTYQAASVTDTLMTAPKLIVKTLVTHPDWQSHSLGTLMIRLLMDVARNHGIKDAIHALMYLDNVSAKAGQRKFNTVSARTYALFQKSL